MLASEGDSKPGHTVPGGTSLRAAPWLVFPPHRCSSWLSRVNSKNVKSAVAKGQAWVE